MYRGTKRHVAPTASKNRHSPHHQPWGTIKLKLLPCCRNEKRQILTCLLWRFHPPLKNGSLPNLIQPTYHFIPQKHRQTTTRLSGHTATTLKCPPRPELSFGCRVAMAIPKQQLVLKPPSWAHLGPEPQHFWVTCGPKWYKVEGWPMQPPLVETTAPQGVNLM